MRFKGQVAVVTGGGSGIGRAIAVQLAAEGACVAIAEIDSVRAGNAADEIEAAGGRSVAVQVDVTDPGSVAEMVTLVERELGAVDVLVNNAVIAPGDGIASLSIEEWDRDVAVSLRGPFLCTREVVPQMVRHGRGAIVNITSVNALIFLGRDAYSAAKAGLISLTRGTAARYGRAGIRANSIAAGTVMTPLWERRTQHDPQIRERVAEWYPSGRVGDPTDIASACAFLASDEASWITGATLVVDGGLTASYYPLMREMGIDEDLSGQ